VSRYSEKQAELQVIHDKLVAQMQHKVHDEDSRIQAAIAERDAKKAAEEAEKAENRAKMMQSIREHRVEQVLVVHASLIGHSLV